MANITVYKDKDILESFAKGASRYDNVQVVDLKKRYKKCDILVTWGIFKRYSTRTSGLLQDIIENHRGPHVVIERGYINRDRYYSVGVGGLNGRANFYNKVCSSDRFSALKIGYGEWESKNTDKILLCGQIPLDASVQHVNYVHWLESTIKHLKDKGKQILFRYHPKIKIAEGDTTVDNVRTRTYSNFRKLIKKSKVDIAEGDLYENFRQVDAMVSFNSNTNVDATLFGLPNFACDKGSMTWDICNRGLMDIDNPKIPTPAERSTWLYRLAYTQWTKREMEKGLPWRRLRRYLIRDKN